MTASLHQRFASLPAPGPEDQLHLARGDLRDYAQLAEYHYKSSRPATATRVLTLQHHRPAVSGRYLGRPCEHRLVGVLIESLPSLNCQLRDWALHDRYRALKDARDRAVALNAEVRCISRVVVHPQWRGLGLAVRLVKAALSDPETPFTEALAAMGRVHPFFERAGMATYRRPPHPFDARLADAFQSVSIEPASIAALRQTYTRIQALPHGQRHWLLKELLRWRRASSAGKATADADLIALLRCARDRLHSEPVYYLKDHRLQLRSAAASDHQPAPLDS
jgi:GNAT superfamily N-acetyltransferase